MECEKADILPYNEKDWTLEITTSAPVPDKTYTVENLPKYKQMLIMMFNVANTSCYTSNIFAFDNTTNQFICTYLTANNATTNTFYYTIYVMITDSTHIRVTEGKTMSVNFYAKIYFK